MDAPTADSQDTASARTPIGGDRDAHGCLPSAGYRWCAHTQRCERPWELAAAEGFDNTAEAFDTFCGPDSAPQDGAADSAKPQ